MLWNKERHGAEYGYRREDNLAYVGKAHTPGYWRVYVRKNLDDPFQLLSREGWVGDRNAMHDADAWLEQHLEGLVAA